MVLAQHGDAPTKIVIIDDQILVRNGIRAILEAHGDLAVVGEAGDGRSGIDEAAEKQPSVILVDIRTLGDEVGRVILDIRTVSPDSAVIALAMSGETQRMRQLLGLGVRGYLLKSTNEQTLVAAIRTARDDSDSVVLVVAGESLTRLHEVSDELSTREEEILRLTSEAMTNGQIAARLGLTEATVKRHLRNIFGKLGAVSRLDAVNKAVAASLIQLPHKYPFTEADGPSLRWSSSLEASRAS